MARKLIPSEKKLASILRVLQEGRPIEEERRRLGVATQTMARFVAAYARKYPEADKRVKATDPLPPPPPAEEPSPAAAATDPAPKLVNQSATNNPGLIDAEAVKRAMEADGGIEAPPRQPGAAGPTPAPPPAAPPSLSTEAEDMAVVEGVGNQVMGLAARGVVTYLEIRWGVKLSHDDLQRIQKLYLLTEVEKAMLKPTARHVAVKAREVIGSDSNIALGVAGSTLLTGLMDRHREITAAMAPLIEKRIAELQQEQAAAEKKA